MREQEIDLTHINCPACYGASESYFAKGYTCPVCGRKESIFMNDIIKHQNRTITNEGMNRIGDTIAGLHIEVARLRKIEAAAVAAIDFDQWQGDEWYELMIALQKALADNASTEVLGTCPRRMENQD